MQDNTNNNTSSMNRLAPGGQVALKLLMSLLAVVLVFFALEGALRVLKKSRVDAYTLTGRLPGPSPLKEWAVLDAFCAYRNKPGLYAEGKTVNSYGFISTPEISPDKEPGTIRIAFLGGSSTAGTGRNLKDADTWPWQTVEKLRKLVPVKVDFINGASGGYTSFESYGRLWSRIRHFHPDIVVVNHGWNEMYYFQKADEILSWRTLPDGSNSWGFETAGMPVALYAPLPIDPWIRWSQLLTRIRFRLSKRAEGEIGGEGKVELADDFNERGIPIWRANLRLLRETCAVIGARLLVIKQPTLIVPGLSPEDRNRCRYAYHGFGHDAHVRAYSAIYRVIDEEIPADSIVDLTIFSGRSEFFFDHVHPTPSACGEIAAAVAQTLASHIPQIRPAGTEDVAAGP